MFLLGGDMFELVSGLAKKEFICDLKLCRVLFEDNSYYPWIFLVPRCRNVKNMTFLSMEERLQLMREIALAEEVMKKEFPCDQINVAMIGNMTPQLHVHVLCRKKGDPDWPNTVWNNATKPYSEQDKQITIMKIKKAFDKEKILPVYKQ